MKLITDTYIPLIEELFSPHFEITQLHPNDITANTLKNADILICRSVTPVNATLLTGTAVKFVGTTTSGYDHLDTAWLDSQGIAWRAAKGCNALAVAEYVVGCVAWLRQQGYLAAPKLRAGIIGVGEVGQRVADKLRLLGFELLLNDPPRAIKDPHFNSVPLSEFKDLDLICIHTPLTQQGDYPTYHLIDEAFLQQQKPDTILLNAGRGGVIDTQTLLRAGQHLHWCLDVYENEPCPEKSLVSRALISTPHIAGHSIQAKWHGTEMIYQQLMAFLNQPASKLAHYPIARPQLILDAPEHTITWQDIVLALYNPDNDSQLLKRYFQENPQGNFAAIRNHYRIRHEFAYPRIKRIEGISLATSDCKIINQLGVVFFD